MRSPRRGDKIKKIISINNQVESDIIHKILDEKNIPHIIRSYHDSAYDGLFQLQRGWGYIEAPVEQEEEILAIYNDLFKKEK